MFVLVLQAWLGCAGGWLEVKRLTDQERLWRSVPESEVLRAVLDYLILRGAYSWRNNTGSVVAEHKGKRRFVRFSEPGAADVFCIYCGRFLAFECKTETGTLSEQQHAWRETIEAYGALYRVCRPSDYQQVIDRVLDAALEAR